MKRSSKILAFAIAAGLAYGSLFVLVGPERVRTWHQQHHQHYGYHHHHHCNDDNGDH